jgi:ABC-type multidrug transport system ATPase subunit
MNTLEFDSLYLEFGMHRVLSGIHMICRTGRIVGLLGRNGSGKSCLMKIVFGAMPAEFKSVRFNGTPLTNGYVEKKIIAYLPQDALLPSFVTFSEAAALLKSETQRLSEIVPNWHDLRNRTAGEVSGGQRRMLEILLVLFSQHPFCILDEPFSGLAPVQIELLMAELHRAKQCKGIIITDHLHRHVRALADDLYVLTNGQTRKILEEEQLVELGYLVEL